VIAAVLLAAALAQEGKLVEAIEVRVASIDVVVRDRSGNPVTGLTRDDFELYENGVPQPITNLYEVRRATAADAQSPPEAAAVPLEVRQRRLVLFVDSASLHPGTKKLVLAAARKFVERMRPEDQAMLVTWRGAVTIVTPFTGDKTALLGGVAQLETFGPAGESPATNVGLIKREIQNIIYNIQTSIRPDADAWPRGYQQAITMIERHAQLMTIEQGRMLEALQRITTNLAGLDGKKALLLVSENLPQRPGAELFRYAYDQFEPHMGTNTPLDLQTLTGVMGNDSPQQIEDFARKASTDGVTIYAIDAGVGENDISAVEMNIGVDMGEAFSRRANTATSLKMMAELTGGVAITQTSNFDLAFDTIGHDLDSYYSLGYKPVGEGNIQARKIVVKAKNRAYSVRSREALTVKSTDDQLSDKVIANLFTDASASTWPISVRTGAPRQDGRAYLVPVEVVMPSTITLLSQEKDLAGAFTLYFVVGTPDGRTSEVMRRPRDLRFPASAESLVRAKPMTFSTAIRVTPGESTLSVAVIDRLSGATGFARTKIETR